MSYRVANSNRLDGFDLDSRRRARKEIPFGYNSAAEAASRMNAAFSTLSVPQRSEKRGHHLGWRKCIGEMVAKDRGIEKRRDCRMIGRFDGRKKVSTPKVRLMNGTLLF